MPLSVGNSAHKKIFWLPMVSGLLGNRHVLILNCDSQSIRSENCSVTRSLLFIYLSNPLRGMLPVVHSPFLMSRKLILYQYGQKRGVVLANLAIWEA